MTYLSKIQLNKQKVPLEELARLFKHGHPGHILAWQAFGGDANKTRDFIFREEHTRDDMVLWTLSSEKPSDWGGYLKVASKPYAPALQSGTTLAFKLRANATIAVTAGKGKRGKRHDVVMHQKHVLKEESKPIPPQSVLVQQAGINWLKNQGIRNGFTVHEQQTIADGYQGHRFRKHLNSKQEVNFHTIDFDGVLTVTDPEKFLTSLQHGLGRTKAYGNGLMLIRKMS